MLRFWVREYNDATSVTSDIRVKVNEAFAAEGIEISFPQLDVHLKTDEDTPLPPVLAGEERRRDEENPETGVKA